MAQNRHEPLEKLIEELNRRGVFSIEEVARKIIQDEMALEVDALPGSNMGSRTEKMIVRSIEAYQDALNQQTKPIIFDRGVLNYVSSAYPPTRQFLMSCIIMPVHWSITKKSSWLLHGKKFIAMTLKENRPSKKLFWRSMLIFLKYILILI